MLIYAEGHEPDVVSVTSKLYVDYHSKGVGTEFHVSFYAAGHVG